MGWGLTLTFLRAGSRFKLHRRLFHALFAQSNVKTFRPIQLREARKASRSLLTAPHEWRDTTLLYTTSIIFQVAFGQEVASTSSPYCAMAEAANRATTMGGIAGSSLVDVLPLVRYIPEFLNPSKPLTHARKSRQAIQTIHEVPWAATLRDMAAGKATAASETPSFMKMHWDAYQEKRRLGRPQDLTLDDIKGATGAVFIAGGNSTWSTVLSCMLFLTKYPSAQREIQREIDAHVGADRLPDFDDWPRLAYLERFVQEVLRVLPLNPLVIPHRSLEDDVYRGMFIPKGTIVFANTTAMSRDPAVYAAPDAFDPDRYERGEPFPSGNFGFGRRKCPGNHLALASVYIFISTLLAVYDIDKVVGPDGVVLEPEPGVTIGLGG